MLKLAVGGVETRIGVIVASELSHKLIALILKVNEFPGQPQEVVKQVWQIVLGGGCGKFKSGVPSPKSIRYVVLEWFEEKLESGKQIDKGPHPFVPPGLAAPIAGFVMLVVGSFRYLLSGGNAKGTETARNTMTFAIVGLVVALSAFIILSLIAQFTGVGTIMQFVIPDSDSGMNFSDPVGGAGGKVVISPN